MGGTRETLRPLTTLRFLAALAVFGHHLTFLADDPRTEGFYNRFLFEGFVGVNFFFILSGFILTYTYGPTIANWRWRETWRFYAARFARVYPVHLLTFLIAAALLQGIAIMAPWRSAAAAVYQLTLTQGFNPDSTVYFSFNAPAWSLSAEAFFYAAFPALLWLLLPLGKSGWPRPVVLAGVVWLAVIGFALTQLSNPDYQWLLSVNPCVRINEFVVGILLGLAFGRGPVRPGSVGRQTVAEIAAVGCLLAAASMVEAVPLPVRIAGYYTPFMAVVIVVFARGGGFVSRCLSAAPLVALGEASFAFYMFHRVVKIGVLAAKPIMDPYGFHPVSVAAIELCPTLALSWVCFRFYEIPARDLVRRWLSGGSAKSANPELQVLIWSTSPVRLRVDPLEARAIGRAPRDLLPAADTLPSSPAAASIRGEGTSAASSRLLNSDL